MGFARRYRSKVMRPATISRAMAERSSSRDTKVALPNAEARFKLQVCLYCGQKGPRLRTGLLAISGPCFFCREHEKQYKEDKDWEVKYKMEEGL